MPFGIPIMSIHFDPVLVQPQYIERVRLATHAGGRGGSRRNDECLVTRQPEAVCGTRCPAGVQVTRK